MGCLFRFIGIVIRKSGGILGLVIVFSLLLGLLPCEGKTANEKKVVVGPWGLQKYITGKETPPKNIQILLRGASVAPEGSSWVNFLWSAIVPAIEKELHGCFALKWYGGGVLGDEIDTIRKMKMKQLQVLGVTNMGLTKMLPEMCVFELPFLFDWEPDNYYAGKYTEIDFILEKLRPTLALLARKHGYLWGGSLETCVDYIFSKIPLTKTDDLKNITGWLFRGDRIRDEINKAFGVKVVPMELYSVAQALSTGMIDSSQMGDMYIAIVLQWWPYLNYITDYPIYGYESASIVMDGRLFDQIIPFFDKWGPRYGFKNGREVRDKFLEIWAHHCTLLRFIIRKDQTRAREKMFKEGVIKEVHFPGQELEKLRKKVLPLYDGLAGEKYPKALLDEILKYREEYRKLRREGKLDDNWFDKGIFPGMEQ